MLFSDNIMIAFRPTWENSGQSPYLRILNLIMFAKTPFPNKETFTGFEGRYLIPWGPSSLPAPFLTAASDRELLSSVLEQLSGPPGPLLWSGVTFLLLPTSSLSGGRTES